MNKGSDSIYVIDDDKLVRFHLSQVLTMAGYSVETFATGAEFLSLPPPSRPACLLLDIQMPGSDGPSIQKQLNRLGWPIPIIFVTGHATVPVTVKALQGGALDVLTKPIDSAQLIRSVENALERSREVFRQQREIGELQERVARLTERELEVFSWVITGKLNKEIAAELKITERTVKAHRASAMEKLSANSIVDLVRVADRLGIRPSA